MRSACDGSGIAGDARIDWPELMRFKRSFTDPVPHEREASFRANGIATYHGVARFIDRDDRSIVAGEPLQARHIVLATGARPAPLEPAGEEHLITSTEFLDLERLPQRIAFVGGGYIAFEFAHLAARAGAAPVIFQRGPRVLTGFEPSLVDDARRGQPQHRNRRARRSSTVERDREARRESTRLRSDRGAEFAVECDLVVHAAGRVADLDDLALDAGGVERTNKGVAVNEFLQSRSNPAVYAVGDCADGGGLPLTPTAAAEGELGGAQPARGQSLLDRLLRPREHRLHDSVARHDRSHARRERARRGLRLSTSATATRRNGTRRAGFERAAIALIVLIVEEESGRFSAPTSSDRTPRS